MSEHPVHDIPPDIQRQEELPLAVVKGQTLDALPHDDRRGQQAVESAAHQGDRSERAPAFVEPAAGWPDYFKQWNKG